MPCRSCEKDPPRSGWVPALHPDDVGVKAPCPKCGKVAVVALIGGGIECKGCGYSKPSPYSGDPGQWVCATNNASRSLSAALSYVGLGLVALSGCAGFLVFMLVVRYDGAAVGGGVSMFVIALVSLFFLMVHWQEYRIASRKAKHLWDRMNDLDHRAARYVRAEMEQDLGF